jgi:hypothetical protein
VYSVTIVREGFEPASESGIKVSSEFCCIDTAYRSYALQPLSGDAAVDASKADAGADVAGAVHVDDGASGG